MIIYDIKLLRFLFLVDALFRSSDERKLCRSSRPLKNSVNLSVPLLLNEVVFTYTACEINLKLLNDRVLGKICRVMLVLAL